MREPAPTGFKGLRVWQEALSLATDAFRLADALPASYAALAEQLRKAADGVQSNIAEGSTWRSKRDFLRYLVMARGSLAEVEARTMLIRAATLAASGLPAAVLTRIPRVNRPLAALMRSLQDRPSNTKKTPHNRRPTEDASSRTERRTKNATSLDAVSLDAVQKSDADSVQRSDA